MTTLATIGYGDLYPVNKPERIFVIFFMLGGVAFFSQVMVQFINIVKNFNEKVNNGEKDVELHNWLALLTKFTDDVKPLPYKLTNSIDTHFAHYWKNDRLGKIESNDIYLNTLP